MEDFSKNDGVVGSVQPNLLSFVKTNVPCLVKTERNAVVKGMAITASVDRVKPRLLLVDLVERHDLKDLWRLKVVGHAYYRYFVVFISLGVYLRGRRVNHSVGDFEGRHRWRMIPLQ